MTNIDKVERIGNRSVVLPWFLTGLATGIALTVLLAPLSGTSTRSLIRRKVKEGKEWAAYKAAMAERRLRAQGAESRDRAKDVADAIGGRQTPRDPSTATPEDVASRS